MKTLVRVRVRVRVRVHYRLKRLLILLIRADNLASHLRIVGMRENFGVYIRTIGNLNGSNNSLTVFLFVCLYVYAYVCVYVCMYE